MGDVISLFTREIIVPEAPLTEEIDYAKATCDYITQMTPQIKKIVFVVELKGDPQLKIMSSCDNDRDHSYMVTSLLGLELSIGPEDLTELILGDDDELGE